MAGTYAELEKLVGEIRDSMGAQVGNLWTKWSNERQPKIQEWLEVRNYVFATDTRTTSNADLPWKNSTTIPKICQIRDNLHANYLSSLLPNDNWLRWIGDNEEDQAKARMIVAYMRDKAHQSKLRDLLSKLVYDYIDFGMAFATAEYMKDEYKLPNGRQVLGYDGPVGIRISPLDIVFNPLAPTFAEAPKIIRSMKSLAEIKKLSEKDERWKVSFEKVVKLRKSIGAFTVDDTYKAMGFSVDGFGNLQQYFGSQYVEVLTFKGDFYDPQTQEAYENQEIIVIDRCHTVYHGDNPSWLGKNDIICAGWRKRPDNLYCMGPLDNL